MLARVYMARSDVGYTVRTAAVHVWKTVVSNTPRTLGEILPALMEQVIDALASAGDQSMWLHPATNIGHLSTLEQVAGTLACEDDKMCAVMIHSSVSCCILQLLELIAPHTWLFGFAFRHRLLVVIPACCVGTLLETKCWAEITKQDGPPREMVDDAGALNESC